MYRGRGKNKNWGGGNSYQRNNNGSSNKGSSQQPRTDEFRPPPLFPDNVAFGNRTSRCSLEEALECQVCLDVAVSPIYSCEGGGHILCSLCHDKLSLPKKCPSCSSQALRVSSVLERMAQKLEYKMRCTNAEAGCTVEVFSTSIGQHLKTCYVREIQCPMKFCENAVTRVKFREFVTHLTQTHGQTPFKNGVVKEAAIPVNMDAGRSCHMAVIHGNSHFVLRMNLTPTIVYFWLVMVGDEKEAKQYYATISLFGKQKWPGNKATVSWSLPVIPFHEDPSTEREKTKPVFGSMERQLFVSSVDTRGAFYMIQLKVEIGKISGM